MLASLPKMFHLSQRYPASRSLDVEATLRKDFDRKSLGPEIKPGMRVAVGVGSRGITNLAEIVHSVINLLRAYGAEPFIIPAMGSHGGATPSGQQNILAGFGVTPETTGVSFETSMDVDQIGTFGDSYPVVFSRAALQADAIVIINRIKPHTDFSGNLGSGIQKMLVIGFGKHLGAANTHRAASQIGHESAIREAAGVILSKVPVLFAVAILEDQHHQTNDLQVICGDEILQNEDALFLRSQQLLPRIPFSYIDLLIVDELGKEISGTGMDTNVIGRGVFGFISSLRPQDSPEIHISRIFVRDLTPATNGNAIGIGLADFTTTRLVNSINREYTYTNVLTSLGLACAKIPLYFDTDREALECAIGSLVWEKESDLRIVRVKNTLSLAHMLVSERLTVETTPSMPVEIDPTPEALLDPDGNFPELRISDGSPENRLIHDDRDFHSR
jgi:hypothetical protein